nr:hypothetical protein CFP56_75819 [Quercus suber]
MVEEPKKATKGRKRERNNILPPFSVSTKEMYSILEAWVKDCVVVLPECKCEPIEEKKRGTLYCRYHRRCDHHTMDCYALRKIFHENMAKDPMEEEAVYKVSSCSVHPPLHNEEMSLRIQQDDKVHSFLKGIGLWPLARREAAQALTQVVERSLGVATSEGSLLQVAYQETRESITFSTRDLAN